MTKSVRNARSQKEDEVRVKGPEWFCNEIWSFVAKRIRQTGVSGISVGSGWKKHP